MLFPHGACIKRGGRSRNFTFEHFSGRALPFAPVAYYVFYLHHSWRVVAAHYGEGACA